MTKVSAYKFRQAVEGVYQAMNSLGSARRGKECVREARWVLNAVAELAPMTLVRHNEALYARKAEALRRAEELVAARAATNHLPEKPRYIHAYNDNAA